ncbi:hypothetical protein R3W88_023928 [Solanum pinnatisectum]|uniref:Uncharacterized protein n=1 Tax=Solanum pinnatisectum TaxID=50273 RepID=A0AAV9M252_9SOLN|nr:hypothetical protein R3W88_023928 [Solanum pinnatisectum]
MHAEMTFHQRSIVFSYHHNKLVFEHFINNSSSIDGVTSVAVIFPTLILQILFTQYHDTSYPIAFGIRNVEVFISLPQLWLCVKYNYIEH